MIDYLNIIKKYYKEGTPLYSCLVEHSKQVADYAMKIITDKKLDNIDADFVYESAMLHDIGIYKTNAPSIYCTGDEPYLMHGLIGSAILKAEGLDKHARVCETHIGAGLTKEEIIAQQLPLPPKDYLPITIEEKLVCYSDNFFSKSHIAPAKSLSQVRMSMSKYGDGTIKRLEDMIKLFA